jgi:hypothetical protein
MCSDPPFSGPAENLGSPAPLYVFCLVTSVRCRLVFVSQSLPFVVLVYFSRSWATKNPAYVAVSRVGKSYGSYDRITCLPKAYRGYTRSDVYSDCLIGSG